ncbi:MAG: endonuclease/exonuclease/phosphatase family protein [Phycisphaerales bacterium JB047]
MQQFLVIVWLILVGCVGLVTLLSLIPGRGWVLRVCDFPRAQMFTLGLVLLAIGVAVYFSGVGRSGDGWGGVVWSSGAILLASVVIQAFWAGKFTALTTPEVPSSTRASGDGHRGETEPPLDGSIRLITANVDYTNADRAAAIDRLMEMRPHVLAMVETDEQWDDDIERYRERYPYMVKELRELGRGMVVLSSFPIEQGEVRSLVDDDRPSIWAELCLPDGRCVRLVVTHPPPPGLPKRGDSGRHSSKKRDIELDIIASRVRSEPEHHWILSGDFNDVGWSGTTMRAKRVSGLRDPRVGRGMFSTFPASLPLLRYPIDHVLVSASFRLVRLIRLDDIGSDHLPLLVDLELASQDLGAEVST